MSAIRTNRNPDLAKLEEEGFRLRVVDGSAMHLLVEGIPAVTSERVVKNGTLYCPLELDAEGKSKSPIDGHQCWWIGDPPCDAAGRVMTEMISNDKPEAKGDGIITTVAFSRKHGDKKPYKDHHEKIWTYVREIWHEARELDKNCDPRSEKPVPAVVEAQERIFEYPDMATTRAGTGAATAKLTKQKIAIVGLGGTGSYILDLVAKTPVDEIHLFDRDEFLLHNAFRSPGAPRKDQLKDPKKVDWFGSLYDHMRKGIVRHPYHVDANNLDELTGFNYVFLAIDSGKARKVIFDGLIARGVPFIDVGMDVAIADSGGLRGMTRFTFGLPEHHAHLKDVVSLGQAEDDGVYRNIQVADLNMLNAAMAVIKWRKACGFYEDNIGELHSTYNVPTHGLSREDRRP